MEGSGKIALAVIAMAVIVSASLLLGLGVFKIQPNSTVPSSQTTTVVTPSGQTQTTVITPASWAQVTSALTVQVTDRDALANSALTEGTNIQSDYWWSTTGQVPMNFLAAASTTTPFGATFNMLPSYNGIFYIRSQIVTGQSYYIIPAIVQSSNPCIQGYDFLDVQNTGTQQWVFQCNMVKSGINPSPNSNAAGSGGTSPLMPYTALAYAYTKPTMTYNNGGSIKSIGTGTNVQNQILYVEKTTAAKAFAVQEIDVQFNTTNNLLWNQGLSNLQLPIESPNGGVTSTTMYFTSANQIYTDGTNYYYKWYFNAPQDTTFGVAGAQQNNNLKGAYMYFALQNGGPAQIQFTTNVYTSLTSNKNVAVTETHVYTTPAQGTDSNNQAVTLCAGTNCT